MFSALPELHLRCRELRWGNPSKKISRKLRRGGAKVSARKVSLCSEVKMALFSRSFVRKRVISMATTASVAATSFALAQDPTKTHHLRNLRGAMPIQYVANGQDRSAEQPFLSESVAAMNKMMADMAIKPTSDIDRDFAELMVPHHWGAVEMAQAERKCGYNERLRRLAQEIVATQPQEITVMRLALGDKLPPSTQPWAAPASQPDASSSSTGPRDAMAHHSTDMR
jgi:hypothetical protein